MSDVEAMRDLVVAGAAALGIYLIWHYLVDPSSGDNVVTQAYNAGKSFAEDVITPLYITAVSYPQTRNRARAQGWTGSDPVVPETPEGSLPSNWTWTMSGGRQVGLPAGMTPLEYCNSNPAAEFCAFVYDTGATSGAGGR